MIGRRFPFLPLLLALAASCDGRGSADAAWAGDVRELPGGAVAVANPAGGIWGAGDAWTLGETLRLGNLDGNPVEIFGRIAGLAFDSDGRLYVFDGQAQELRVFSRDGEFLWGTGRAGSGPGEFRVVVGMRIAPDGSLWLVDPENQRFTIVRGGEVEVRPREGGVYRVEWFGGFTPDGDFYDSRTVTTQDGTYRDVLVRVTQDGAATDTLAVALPEFAVPQLGSVSFPLPYAPVALRAFDARGYLWTAQSHEYRLVQTSLRGDTIRIVSRALDPPALSPEQEDSIQRHATALRDNFGILVTENMRPRTAPLLKWFVLDDGGNIWVARASANARSSVDVFDPSGRFLGQVALPFEHADLPPVIRGDTIVIAILGEAGVPQVVTAVIQKPVAAVRPGA